MGQGKVTDPSDRDSEPPAARAFSVDTVLYYQEMYVRLFIRAIGIPWS